MFEKMFMQMLFIGLTAAIGFLLKYLNVQLKDPYGAKFRIPWGILSFVFFAIAIIMFVGCIFKYFV